MNARTWVRAILLWECSRVGRVTRLTENVYAFGCEILVLPFGKGVAHELLTTRLDICIYRAERDGTDSSDRDIEFYQMEFIVLLAQPVKAWPQHLRVGSTGLCPRITEPTCHCSPVGVEM